jgi:polyhydroxybutyrate depolymerase
MRLFSRKTGIALLWALPMACTHAQRGPAKYLESLSFENESRDYTVLVPKSYNPATGAPLVLVLHGLTSDKDQIYTNLDIERKAEQEGFIAVIPNGTGKLRGWNTGFFTMGGHIKDVSFIETILDKVSAEFKVRPNEQFVIGHSNGAMMALALGSKLPGRFAAICSIAGTIGIPAGTAAEKAVPPLKIPSSVLLMHGEKDNMVAFGKESQSLLRSVGAEDSLKWWAEQIGCEMTPKTALFEAGYRTITYAGGKNGTEAVLYASASGTHLIPGGIYRGATETQWGFSGIDVAWEFFKNHPKK